MTDTSRVRGRSRNLWVERGARTVIATALTVILVVLVVTIQGSFGAWTETLGFSGETISTGVVEMELVDDASGNDARFGDDVGPFVPGDQYVRYLSVVNQGSRNAIRTLTISTDMVDVVADFHEEHGVIPAGATGRDLALFTDAVFVRPSWCDPGWDPGSPATCESWREGSLVNLSVLQGADLFPPTTRDDPYRWPPGGVAGLRVEYFVCSGVDVSAAVSVAGCTAPSLAVMGVVGTVTYRLVGSL